MHALDLDVGKAIPLVDSPLAGAAKPRRVAWCAAAKGGGDHQSAAICVVALAGPLTRHFDHLRSIGASVFLTDSFLAGDVGRVGPDVQLLAFTLAVACQGRVEADGLLVLVLRR